MEITQNKVEKLIADLQLLLTERDDETETLVNEAKQNYDLKIKTLQDTNKELEERNKELANQIGSLKQIKMITGNTMESSNIYTEGIWKYVPLMVGVGVIIVYGICGK